MTLESSGIWTANLAFGFSMLLLAGCGYEDRRHASDAEACRSMGHVDGSTEYKHCLNDLNDRRCAIGSKGHHYATFDCTRW